jgi:hypothetical protein
MLSPAEQLSQVAGRSDRFDEARVARLGRRGALGYRAESIIMLCTWGG